MVLKFNECELRWEVYYNITRLDNRWKEIIDWCWQTFGHPGAALGEGIWDYSTSGSAGVYFGAVYVFTESDAMMFNLRWT